MKEENLLNCLPYKARLEIDSYHFKPFKVPHVMNGINVIFKQITSNLTAVRLL